MHGHITPIFVLYHVTVQNFGPRVFVGSVAITDQTAGYTSGHFRAKYFPSELQPSNATCTVSDALGRKRRLVCYGCMLLVVCFFLHSTPTRNYRAVLNYYTSRPVFLLTRLSKPNCDWASSRCPARGEHARRRPAPNNSPRSRRHQQLVYVPHSYRFSAFHYHWIKVEKSANSACIFFVHYYLSRGPRLQSPALAGGEKGLLQPLATVRAERIENGLHRLRDTAVHRAVIPVKIFVLFLPSYCNDRLAPPPGREKEPFVRIAVHASGPSVFPDIGSVEIAFDHGVRLRDPRRR